MLSLRGLGKRPQGILQNQSTRGFFGCESGFQNCFWNLFSTSGLSQIWKIINVRKLPSPFSRNTLIPCAEKSSWSLKTSFWKKNCPVNSKTVIQDFFNVRKSVNLRTSWFLDIQRRSPKTIDTLCWIIFLPK
jgi:hypothetical protein